jgi:hypothetical protein
MAAARTLQSSEEPTDIVDVQAGASIAAKCPPRSKSDRVSWQRMDVHDMGRRDWVPDLEVALFAGGR